MTALATFGLATYNRPELLRHTLRHAQAQEMPEGWELEIVVAAPANDPGLEVCRQLDQRPHPVRTVVSPSSKMSQQFATLFANCKGEFTMWSGDDDLQHSQRLKKTCAVFRNKPVGCDQLYFFNTKTKDFARWEGPSNRAGATYTFTGEQTEVVGLALQRADFAKHGDGKIRDALASNGLYMDKYDRIDVSCVALSHGGNVSGTRKWPRLNQKYKVGSFWIYGIKEPELEAHTRAAIHLL